MGRPGTLKFYKSKGAAAFQVIPPSWDDRGFLSKQGAVLLEAAPGVGRQEWDWQQKIVFAISIADVAKIIDGDPDKRRILHKKDDKIKVLEFVPGEGRWEGTWQMHLSEGSGANRRTIMVPFDGGEYTVLIRLLLSMCPLLLGWGENAIQGHSSR